MRFRSLLPNARPPAGARGQSVVEFAFMVPILILLVAGAIDLGNGYQTWINLTNAAREGARKASTTANSTVICNRVVDELANTDITVACGNVAVTYPGAGGADTCTTGTRATGCPVRVTVTYAMNTLLGGVFGFNSITITGSVDMIVFSA